LDYTFQNTTERNGPPLKMVNFAALNRFEYFINVVPTIYIADDFGRKIIETNQYAVTQSSAPCVGQAGHNVPGNDNMETLS